MSVYLGLFLGLLWLKEMAIHLLLLESGVVCCLVSICVFRCVVWAMLSCVSAPSIVAVSGNSDSFPGSSSAARTVCPWLAASVVMVHALLVVTNRPAGICLFDFCSVCIHGTYVHWVGLIIGCYRISIWWLERIAWSGGFGAGFISLVNSSFCVGCRCFLFGSVGLTLPVGIFGCFTAVLGVQVPRFTVGRVPYMSRQYVAYLKG